MTNAARVYATEAEVTSRLYELGVSVATGERMVTRKKHLGGGEYGPARYRHLECEIRAADEMPKPVDPLEAEIARLRERVAALAVLADHVEDAWQDEGVNGDGFVFSLNWFLSVARGEELSPYLKDRAALDGQPAAGGA